MIFPRKKNDDNEDDNFVDILREHPDEFFVCDNFVAMWVPEFEKGLFIFGNFWDVDEDKIQRLLQAKVSTMVN